MKKSLHLAGLLAVFAALPAAANDHAGSAADEQAQAGAPLLVARADGSWTITRTIREAPVSLAYATDGLVLLEDEAATVEAAEDGARDAMREFEEERTVRRAYEEAVDQARQDALTPQ
ncbi:MAG: hypothetical protein ACXWUN_10365 [Allosphingosinicella sp.]